MTGMSIGIRVAPAVAGEPMPPAAALVAIWNRHNREDQLIVEVKEDGAVEWISEALWSDSDYDETEAHLSLDDDKWNGDLDQTATEIAARYPHVVVTTAEEWTGEEPYSQSRTYRDGKLVTATVEDQLPAGFQGTARGLANTLTDDLARLHGAVGDSNQPLVDTVERTIAFLNQLGGKAS